MLRKLRYEHASLLAGMKNKMRGQLDLISSVSGTSPEPINFCTFLGNSHCRWKLTEREERTNNVFCLKDGVVLAKVVIVLSLVSTDVIYKPQHLGTEDSQSLTPRSHS
jgi:hypothetical protein